MPQGRFERRYAVPLGLNAAALLRPSYRKVRQRRYGHGLQGAPQHFNSYDYAYNNPYKFTDPDGRCPIAKDGIPCQAIFLPGKKPSNEHLVSGLHAIAAELDRPLIVYSGNRSQDQNKEAKGAKKSAHLTGDAADVTIQGMSKREIAKAIFFSEARERFNLREVYHLPGNGQLPEHTHLDTKTGPDIQQNKGGAYGPLNTFDDETKPEQPQPKRAQQEPPKLPPPFW